ncbi:hypothetical protein ACOSQ2_021413 [Xanthoceras sorbifolium]
MSYFNTAEINGEAIDEPSQVSIILITLPKSFDQFKSNYGMNKLQFSLTQLLNELATFEALTKDKINDNHEERIEKKTRRKLKKKNSREKAEYFLSLD